MIRKLIAKRKRAQFERMFPRSTLDPSQHDLARLEVVAALRRAREGLQQMIDSNPKGAH